MGFEVYSQKGLDFEKVADTERMEDSEKVLENYQKGYVTRDGQAVIHKGVRPTDIERRMRKNKET
jgi:hypothetical protein